MSKINYIFLPFLLILVISYYSSCTTVDIEKEHENTVEEIEEPDPEPDYSFTENLEHIEEIEEEPSVEEVMTEEIAKEVDISAAIIYAQPPQIISGTIPEKGSDLVGTDALKQNLKDITVLPKYSEGRLEGWVFKEGNIYQVHCQTYHSTMIQLEPGEEMVEVPYISEPDVWRISRGIGTKEGLPTQFLIIKPDQGNLCTTLIIITNRRIYQLELLSFRDHYMPYVKWLYPQAVKDMDSWNQWIQKQQQATNTVMEFSASSMENASFDYIIRYGKKPQWCPKLVYDDGRFTYIVLDKKTLMTEMPVLFLGSKKLTNTHVHDNVIVINQLIEKATLRLGKEKVTIIKKKG